MANIEMIEFRNNDARDTRVKGSKRLMVITHGSVVTRMEIKGEAIEGTELFTVSDVTVPTPLFEKFKDVILQSAKP
jgi:hypothetical protein